MNGGFPAEISSRCARFNQPPIEKGRPRRVGPFGCPAPTLLFLQCTRRLVRWTLCLYCGLINCPAWRRRGLLTFLHLLVFVQTPALCIGCFAAGLHIVDCPGLLVCST